MHQFIVAALTCPVCGKTTPADTSTNIQIGELPVRTEPPHYVPDLYIRVGDRLKVRLDRLGVAGFRPTGRAARAGGEIPGAPYRALVPWTCPCCKTPDQWAVVELSDHGDEIVVESVTAVPKAAATLQQVDAVLDLIVDEHAFGVDDWMPVLAASL